MPLVRHEAVGMVLLAQAVRILGGLIAEVMGDFARGGLGDAVFARPAAQEPADLAAPHVVAGGDGQEGAGVVVEAGQIVEAGRLHDQALTLPQS